MKRSVLSSLLILVGAEAIALPQVGEVISGNATISQPDAVTVQITQGSDKAVLNWESFNIGSDEKAIFLQPSSSAIALNRINGANGASNILGQLQANGQVWILNSSGVIFGNNAQINVGSLLASTSMISIEDFLAGQYRFNDSQSTGAIINKGFIKAADGGQIFLVGNGVQNQGIIEANLGKVVLAGAKSFILTFAGNPLFGFEIQEGPTSKAIAPDGSTLNNAVENSGTILSNGGKVLLTTHVAQNIVDNAINMSGTIEANSVSVNQKGEIVLSANQGKIKTTGQLKSSSGKVLIEGETITTEGAHISTSSNSDKGGTIHLLGKDIKLFDSNIEANGALGGGEILVGGNYQGAGPELNADFVFADQGTSLFSNATLQGNGGKIIVWGNEATQFYGSINAQGGGEDGNGGFIETSGHYLDVLGAKINLAAPKGSMGTWLLDPADITISDSATASADLASPTYSPTSGASSSIIYSGDLGAALHSANIIVTTNNSGSAGSGSGDIFVTGLSNLQGVGAWETGDTTTLTLQAGRNIQINTPINLGGSGKGLILSAGNSVQGHIQINSAIDGHFDLTLSSGNVGGSTINSPIGANTALRSFAITQGTSDIAYNITTTGAQTFNEQARFSGAAAPVLSGSTLTFLGGMDLANSMELDASLASSIDGTITGVHGITKSGDGALTISGDNNYTGGTTIKSGSIIATSTNALGTSGTISLAPTAGSTVNLDLTALSSFGNSSAITLDTSLFGSNAALKTGAITLSNDIELAGSSNTFNTSGATILSGDISGAGGFTKAGTSAIQLSGNNSYTGTTTISSGTLNVSSAEGLGGSSSTTVASGGSLYLGFSGTLANSNPIYLAGNGNDNYTAALIAGSNLNLNNDIQLNDSARISVVGESTLTLNGDFDNNSYYPAFYLSDGIIEVTGDMTGTGGVVTAGNTSGTLKLSGENSYTGYTRLTDNTSISLEPTAIFTNSIDLRLDGDNTSFNVNNKDGLVFYSLSGSGSLENIGDITINGGDYSGTISGGGSVTKATSDALSLTGTENTYQGGTVIEEGSLLISDESLLGSGGLTISGGTLGGNDADLILTKAITLNADMSFFVDAGNVMTYEGSLTGAHGVIKTGSGSLTLSGANFYTGTTKITGGTLIINQDSNLGGTSNTLDLNGGTLQTSGTFDIAQTRTVTLTADSSIEVLSGILGYDGNIGDGGSGKSLTKKGVGTLELGGNNTYSGGTIVDAGTLKLLSSASLLNASAVTINDGIFDFNHFSRALSSLNGNGGKLSNIGDITINSGIYSGEINGSGNLIKETSSILTLSGSNTYSGTTTVNAGALSIGSAGGLGNTSGTTVNSGATLDMNFVGTLNNTADITLNGTGVAGVGALTFSSDMLMINDITLGTDTSIGGIGTGILSGVVSGDSKSLTKVGSGTLYLAGGNTYSGTTTVSSGTLSLGIDNALSSNSAVSVASDASLDLNGNAQTFSSLSGAGSVTNIGDITVNSGSFSGAIDGTGSLTKATVGNLSLSGENTYSGTTVVNAGTLSIGNASGLGATSSITINPGATLDMNFEGILNNAASITLNGAGYADGGALTLSSGMLMNNDITLGTDTSIGGIGTGILTGIISGDGKSLTKIGNGTLYLAVGNTYSGATIVSGGTLSLGIDNTLSSDSAVSVASGATLDLNDNAQTFSSLSGAGSVANIGAITVNSGNFNGEISGTGSLTKASAGTLSLSGANTYSGVTIVSDGTLSLGIDNTLSSGSAVIVASGATLDLNSNDQIFSYLSGAGSVANIDDITINSGNFSGVIDGTGSLTKATVGNLSLRGANTYSGATIVSGGTLALGIDNTLSSDSAVSVASGATLDLNSNDQTFSSLSGTGSVDDIGAITVNSGNFNGEISGTGSLTKASAGTLSLSGANTYNGVTVSGGTLSLGIDNTLSSDSAVSIASGATLDLNGNAQTFISLSGAGTVANIGDITINSGNFSGEIGGTGSLTKATIGTLSLSGTNTYTGATTINGGILSLTSNNALSSSSQISMGANTTLNLNDTTQLFKALNSADTSAAISNMGSLTVQSGIYTGTLNEGAVTASLTKSGAGTFSLGGTHSYTGATTINEGKIVFLSNESINSSNSMNVSSGSTLDLNNTAQTFTSLSGSGLVSNIPTSGGLTIGTGNTNSTFSGTLNGGLLKLEGGGSFNFSNTSNSISQLNIQNADNVTFKNAGTLSLGPVNANTLNLTTDGNMNFNQAFNSTQLNLSATGDINFNTLVGNTTPLSQILISNANNLNTLYSFKTGSFTQYAGSGTSNFSGGLTSTGNITVNTGFIRGTLSAPTLSLTSASDMNITVSGGILTVYGPSGTIIGSLDQFIRGSAGKFTFNGIAEGINLPTVVAVLPQITLIENITTQTSLSPIFNWLGDASSKQKSLFVSEDGSNSLFTDKHIIKDNIEIFDNIKQDNKHSISIQIDKDSKEETE